MKELLREPLVHFLVGGAALFLLYASREESEETGAWYRPADPENILLLCSGLVRGGCMRVRLTLAVICAVAFALPTWAHHSHGNYEDTFTDIEGVVTELHYVVPHSWVYIEVADPSGGESQFWALEATGRGGLERIGVDRDYMQVGDTITARCHRLRDGSNGCLPSRCSLSSGYLPRWASTYSFA